MGVPKNLRRVWDPLNVFGHAGDDGPKEMDPEARKEETDKYFDQTRDFQNQVTWDEVEAGRRLDALGQRQGVTEPTQRGQAFAGQQRQLMDALRARAAGGPSAAEMGHQGSVEGNLQAALAANRGGQFGGGNPGMMAALGRGNTAAMGQAMKARVGEQAAAEQALAGVMQGARDQDLRSNKMGIDTQLANLEAQRQTDDMTRYYMSYGMDVHRARLEAQKQLSGMYTGQYAGMEIGRAKGEQQQRAANMALAGSAMTAFGSGFGADDDEDR